jgi:hypothetical protein
MGHFPKGHWTCAVAVDLSTMVVSFLLFFVSSMAFIVLMIPALLGLVLPFVYSWFIFYSIWLWVAVGVFTWQIVRTVELMNAPDWKGVGQVVLQSVIITITCPNFWPVYWGWFEFD